MDPRTLLTPEPQRVRTPEAVWQLPIVLRSALPGSTPQSGSQPDSQPGSQPQPPSDALLRRLERTLRPLGRSLEHGGGDQHGDGDGDANILLTRESEGPAEGYRLSIDAEGVRLRAATDVGLGHGLATLGQWLRLHSPLPPNRPTTIPALEIEDWPDLPVRGVMLDISRNKVPKLETLLALIERLADFKINHLQLYTEHTFAYRGHGVVWRDADPLTADDLGRLVTACENVGIELAPNQNSFGHFHRWLVHDAYRPLAECPDGIAHPFSDVPEPFSLCPLDPGSLELLTDLYDQLLPHFPSTLFNVGLDETFDLGQGRSATACEERGRDRVYLDFLNTVHGLAQERGRRMLFWGDVILDHPERIPELPRDAIALAWGYEAEHPFADNARRFAEAGLEFWLCPGTSSWNSFGGRLHNALDNLASAVRAARDHGARGLLITDWGDHGHLQPLPIAYPALVAGAAMAWNARSAEEPTELPIEAWLDTQVFGEPPPSEGANKPSLGHALLTLGAIDRQTGAPPEGQPGINGSALFFQLLRAGLPVEERRGEGMTLEHLKTITDSLAQVRRTLSAVRPKNPEATLAKGELAWVADVLDFARRLAQGRLTQGPERPLAELPRALRQALVEELNFLVPQRRDLWMARNRPGGWAGSAAKLTRIRSLLLSEAAGEPEPRP